MDRETIEISVDASLRAVRLLAAACQGVFAAWGVSGDRRTILELALVEAATNAVRHAYRDLPPGPVTVRLLRTGTRLTMTVVDRGQAFDPAAIPPKPEPDPDDPSTWPEGGMGLGIIRAAADEVEYASEGGENRLSILIDLPELRGGS